MNLPQANSYSLQHSNCTPMSRVLLPDEIIADVLSFLTVKSLMRFRCVSKSWNSLVSDPTFIKSHLKKSAPNTHLTLFLSKSRSVDDGAVLPFPVRSLPNNLSVTLADDWIVGSCNGLICLLSRSFTIEYVETWFSFWNPATRKKSGNLGLFRSGNLLPSSSKFAFGYDRSTDTYKIVALHFDNKASQVKVLSMGDNVWRSIQNIPAVPLSFANDGVYLSGTLNWLAIRSDSSSVSIWSVITIDRFVIVSLDLGTETYRLLQPPRGFDEVPRVEPTVCVLMGCLCFSHDFKGTHFVIWKMTEYGVEESWTQLFKISYQTLQNGDIREYFHFQLLPLCLSENGDTLILANDLESQAILYNWRDNIVERIRITNGKWRPYVKEYVESLVSTC